MIMRTQCNWQQGERFYQRGNQPLVGVVPETVRSPLISDQSARCYYCDDGHHETRQQIHKIVSTFRWYRSQHQ